MPTPRRLPGPVAFLRAAVVGVAVLAAGCAGGNDGDATPTTRPASSAPATVSTPVPTVAVTDPPADTESSTPASEPPATAPATTEPAGPLEEPSVALSEIGTFDQPLEVAVRPGDDRIYVAEQPGRVVVVADGGSEVVLDITEVTNSGGERGLLGLAFHPTDDVAYVHYTGGNGQTVVAEFAVDPATGVFDRASEREVLTVDQPYSNHNGGELTFGPDGMLYIGLGDGGSRNDPDRVALDLSSRLGKILRIDPRPTGGQPFGIPADNPLVGTDGAEPAIWSYGLRNPWKFSFDPLTGDLWIADVGQGEWEEVDRAEATDGTGAGRGLNFGWSAFEGFERFNEDQPSDGAVPPVHVYDHSGGRCSVSGGIVVRDSPISDLDGWYVFGDYCTGEIWAFDPSSPADQPRVVAIGTLPGLAAVAAGPDGEVYAVSNGGPVARLVAG